MKSSHRIRAITEIWRKGRRVKEEEVTDREPLAQKVTLNGRPSARGDLEVSSLSEWSSSPPPP